MKLLAISGSGRQASTNTAMLRALASIARPDHQVTVFDRVCDLPVFSPDLEAMPLPNAVQDFAFLVGQSDGVIMASPEYARSIPGGLKNAIDWLVSRDEIIGKPVALMHASHRGDEMLKQLRIVLATVSSRFREDLFLRFELMKKSPEEIAAYFEAPRAREDVARFIRQLTEYCGRCGFEADASTIW